jgi:hypothetical protein
MYAGRAHTDIVNYIFSVYYRRYHRPLLIHSIVRMRFNCVVYRDHPIAPYVPMTYARDDRYHEREHMNMTLESVKVLGYLGIALQGSLENTGGAIFMLFMNV